MGVLQEGCEQQDISSECFVCRGDQENFVKIIRQGKLSADEVYQAECNQCGTVLEFQRKEARFESDQRDGDALVVTCPTCQHEIWTAVRSRYDR